MWVAIFHFSSINFLIRNLLFLDILQGIKNVSSLFVDNVLKKLFIGTKLGQVYHTDLNSIYSLKESSLRPIKVSKTYIRMFRVNCDDTKLAVASKSSDVSIIPIDQLDSEADPTLLRLKGHSQPIVWVDFSSKNPDLLLSTSYDSALRTWDVSKGVATKSTTADDVSEETIVVSSMACYEFNVKLKYAIFSPLNENCIIVGTHSTPFYVFNWTTKTKEFPPTIVNCKREGIYYLFKSLIKNFKSHFSEIQCHKRPGRIWSRDSGCDQAHWKWCPAQQLFCICQSEWIESDRREEKRNYDLLSGQARVHQESAAVPAIDGPQQYRCRWCGGEWKQSHGHWFPEQEDLLGWFRSHQRLSTRGR